MSDLAYKISVMQAALEGKNIQLRHRNGSDADWVGSIPAWDWTNYDYRIAPETRKPRECWVHFKKDGSVTVGDYSVAETTCDHSTHINCEYVRVREVIEE